MNTRYLTTSTTKPTPSSKIEETVERLKEKKKSEEPETTGKEDSKKEATATTIVKDEATKVVDPSAKKSLWIRFKDEVRHYYSGFKLLCLDVNVSSKIMWKIVRGKPLTRRESRQLVRTTSVIFISFKINAYHPDNCRLLEHVFSLTLNPSRIKDVFVLITNSIYF